MPKTDQKSPVVMVALLLSAVLALALAAYYAAPLLLSREGTTTGTEVAAVSVPAAGPEPMTEQPAATPTPTPTPEPTPEPTASPATPSPTPAEASPTPSPSPTPSTVTVIGTIRNAEGEPVAGGQVYLIARGEGRPEDMARQAFRHAETHEIITADGEGVFRARIAAERAFILGLMINGEPSDRMQELRPSPAGETISTIFNLSASYEIRGTVTDEFASLLPEMPLVVEWVPETLREAAPERRRTALQTDAQGRFVVRLHEPRSLSIGLDTANLPEPYLYEKSPLELTPRDFRDGRNYRVDFQVLTGSDLGGRVMESPDSANPGEPIAGVEIELRETASAMQQAPRRFAATSDEQGFFTFDLLPPASYVVTARKEGFMTYTLRELKPLEVASLPIELSPLASALGTVGLQVENLPAGATANVYLVNRYTAQGTQIPLVPDGAFRFAQLSGGNHVLAAVYTAGEDRWYGEKSVYIGAQPQVDLGHLPLNPVVELAGELVIAPGSPPVQRVAVTAEPATPEDGLGREMNADGHRLFPVISATDSGRFVVDNLLSGTEYKFTALDRETGDLLGAAVAVAGDEAAAVRIPTVGVGTVTGTLRAGDGTACVGVEVHLTTGLGTIGGASSVHQLWRTTSRFDGSFRFDNVPTGQARLVLREDEDVKRLISVPRGQVLNVDLACRLYVDVEFQLSTAEGSRPFAPGEQLLVVAMPGYQVSTNVREIRASDARVRLEPGRYTVTRTTTMDSREFDVVSRMLGRVSLEF